MLIEKTIKETSWISPINNATYIGKVFYCLECGNDMNKCLYLNRFIIERRNKKIHNHTIGKLLIR